MPFGCVSCADTRQRLYRGDQQILWSSMPFGCVSCADRMTKPPISILPKRVFNAFRLCVLCGHGAHQDLHDLGENGLQCLSAVCPVRTGPSAEEIQAEIDKSSMPFGCVSCADGETSRFYAAGLRSSLQCLSAVCPVRTHPELANHVAFQTLSSMPFGCVSCADHKNDALKAAFALAGLQCLSAVCPVRTPRKIQGVSLLPLVSSMPFGCVSCADHNPAGGKSPAGNRGLQCLSAVCPVRTKSPAGNRGRGHVVFNAFRLCVLCGHLEMLENAYLYMVGSSMPFGCVSCADRKIHLPKGRGRKVVFNAFRLCVLCGRNAGR